MLDLLNSKDVYYGSFVKIEKGMLTKEQVMNSLKDMPDKFSIDDLVDKLILMQKIEIGLEQSKKGQVYIVEEAKEMLKKWSK